MRNSADAVMDSSAVRLELEGTSLADEAGSGFLTEVKTWGEQKCDAMVLIS